MRKFEAEINEAIRAQIHNVYHGAKLYFANAYCEYLDYFIDEDGKVSVSTLKYLRDNLPNASEIVKNAQTVVKRNLGKRKHMPRIMFPERKLYVGFSELVDSLTCLDSGETIKAMEHLVRGASSLASYISYLDIYFKVDLDEGNDSSFLSPSAIMELLLENKITTRAPNKARKKGKEERENTIIAMAEKFGWGSDSRERMARKIRAHLSKENQGKLPRGFSLKLIVDVLKEHKHPTTQTGRKKAADD